MEDESTPAHNTTDLNTRIHDLYDLGMGSRPRPGGGGGGN